MQNDFQIFLKRTPALKLLLGFIAGILMQDYLKINIYIYFTVFVLSIILFLIYNFLSIKIKYKFRWTTGLLILFLMVCIGSIAHHFNNITHNTRWYGHFSKTTAYKVIITSPLEEKEKTFKTTGNIISVQANNAWEKTEGEVLIYFRKDSLPQLQTGTQIIFKKPLQLIKNAGNPGEFNYQKYINQQNIYHQIFLNVDEYKLLQEKKLFPVKAFLFSLRNHIIKIIDKYIHGSEERAVAKALLIGYRKDIDRELYSAFTNTGIVHIIAISGMHLAMIYAAMLFIFKNLRRKKNGKTISGLITLVVIWMFTFLAGSVPSITRAAVMFSFIIVGEMLQRKTNIYNSLAASAFVLLLYNTFTLWDVGFLLSYSAVLSIVVFQRPVSRLLYVENKILKSLWSIVYVTLSAQILTLPFILYYFHQFPNLFIISNLIAIPLSGIILYMEIALMVFSPVPFIASLIGKVTESLITFFNDFIRHINEIPFVRTNNIHINFVQMTGLFLVIICLYQFIKGKNKNWLYGFFIILAMILSINIYQNNDARAQMKIVVYNSVQNLIIDFINGKKVHTIAKYEIDPNSPTDVYITKPAHYYYRTRSVENMPALKTNFPLISFFSYTIFILNQNAKLPNNIAENVELLIIDNYSAADINMLHKIFPNALFIFANTNKLWKIEQWKKQCNTLNLRCHSNALDGAYIVELK